MIRQLFLLVALAAAAFPSPLTEEFLERDGRIVGGSNAPLGRFPYMAALRNSRNGFFCGASIVNNRWVLSAAHCTVGFANNGIRVTVGTVSLSSGGVTHTSSRVVNHPNYNSNTFRADVSLVQTATVMTFNTNVRALALGSTQIGGNVNAMITGWGGTSGSGQSQLLQQLTVVTMTNAECRNRVPRWSDYIIDQKLCAWLNNRQG
jgi:secreted trypsin-like serine protease